MLQLDYGREEDGRSASHLVISYKHFQPAILEK